MNGKQEISRLKRELELLEVERDALLEASEDVHLLANLSAKINALEGEDAIIDTILESICILKDTPYASFLEKEKDRFRVSGEYVNSNVVSKLGEEFTKADFPVLLGLKKKPYIARPDMPLETRVFLPHPPERHTILLSYTHARHRGVLWDYRGMHF